MATASFSFTAVARFDSALWTRTDSVYRSLRARASRSLSTLASRDIYNAFLSDSKADALLHGHSYSAHAVGCAVANEALNQIARLEKDGVRNGARARWAPTATEEARVWSLWDPTFVKALSKHDRIAEVMALGTVLAVKVKAEQGGKNGVQLRAKTIH